MSKIPPAECIPLRRESVDPGVLMELTTEVMQRQARALGVTLDVRVDDAVPDIVHLDRDKVAWTITSLVGSALRHVRAPGGIVSVQMSYNADRPSVSISVRDDGPGIPSDRLTRFLRRGSWQPGSALALLLAEDIAVAHGGSLEIESATDRANHFTSIRLTIPAASPAPAGSPPSSSG